MAAGTTYESISTNTLSSATNSIIFSSIPSTYTDLVLVMQLTTAAATNMRIRFNSDSTANYTTQHLEGSASGAYAVRETGETACLIDYNGVFPNGGSTSFSTYIIDINGYKNTTTFKSFLSRGNNASNGVNVTAGLWRSTSAINSIEVRTSSGGNISVGSIFTLYGITEA